MIKNPEIKGFFHNRVKDFKFEDLIGETLTSIERLRDDGDLIRFKTESGFEIEMLHWEDGWEKVYLESVVGSFQDLIGVPILLAEESIRREVYDAESSTWSSYKLSTKNGYVYIHWYGWSNGDYSEEVHFRVTKRV